MPNPLPPDADELDDEGTLVVEEQRFAIVPDWVITAQISDAAFRVYSMLLRFGNTSGCRMPSRALLGQRLHRSVDSIDRALRELSGSGIVRVEHRHDGRQFRSNRYHVRTSPPPAQAGGRNAAATPGRTSAARVAAEVRHYPDVFTETEPPPPAPSTTPAVSTSTSTAVEVADQELLAACDIADIAELSRRCIASRNALGQPTGRWTPQCLTLAIRMAVVNRGWPASDVVAALLAVAADRQTRSPVRVAEAGPWWDTAASADTEPDDDLADLETRLADLGGRRVTLQAQARTELAGEGLPLTRATVLRRAAQILDRMPEPA